GQGSQYTGMGADLAMAFPAARAVWDKAASHPVTGALKLHRLAFPPLEFFGTFLKNYSPKTFFLYRP
ncbi:MAG: hypothetical protein ACK4Q5_16360, partial [Saprospiraceae bacterium]